MSATEICLINPPHPYLKDPKAQAPLGLLYVAAAVRKQGFKVHFVDLSDKHYLDEFEIPECTLYGITGTVLDRRAVETVARTLKRRDKRCRVIVGGPIALSADKLDRKLIDSFVLREGEEAVLQAMGDYPRLARRYEGRRIKTLDALPFPARDLLGGNLGGCVFAHRQEYFDGGSTVFVTSRGCPFDCTFCASPKLWGQRIVYRSISAIVDEICHVRDRWGVKQFRFSDDNLTTSRERVARLCRRLSPFKVAWRASIRVKPNDVAMFEEMRDGGCTEVCFGVESGDDAVLRALRKKTTVEDNRTAIVNAKRAGLVVRVLFMAGTPGETEDTHKRNIGFLEAVKEHYDTLALTNFVPLPGTAVAEEPVKNGVEILDDDIDKFNLCMWGPDDTMNEWPHLVRPVGMSLDKLTEAKEAMRRYAVESGKTNRG